MSEKPIIFSSEMIRAILNGTKTQTRRVVKQPRCESSVKYDPLSKTGWSNAHGYPINPPCSTGDVLWCRETWTDSCGMLENALSGKKIHYCADCEDDSRGLFAPCRWKKKPSIHMSRVAARLFLRVADVRVERLQAITEADARAEGCTYGFHDDGVSKHLKDHTPQKQFAAIWDSLYSKRGYGWDTNPWVWVISFERVTP